MGGSRTGYGTWFTAMGQPFGGCGVPPSKANDDNGKPLPFVALNTNSEFKNGANCGRFVLSVFSSVLQAPGSCLCVGGMHQRCGVSAFQRDFWLPDWA